jgi:hypothetical protein
VDTSSAVIWSETSGPRPAGHERRFIYETQVERFLEVVAETSASRTETLKKGSRLWRAQLGSTYDVRDKGTDEGMEVEVPYFEGRMKPIPALAKDGRKPEGCRLSVPCRLPNNRRHDRMRRRV